MSSDFEAMARAELKAEAEAKVEVEVKAHAAKLRERARQAIAAAPVSIEAEEAELAELKAELAQPRTLRPLDVPSAAQDQRRQVVKGKIETLERSLVVRRRMAGRAA
jgi:hypothetical protein